ncbi:unnamed protein product [Auanema sp. JU1783]|nr:unnamed protein product [Auanema sp. JU1783]
MMIHRNIFTRIDKIQTDVWSIVWISSIIFGATLLVNVYMIYYIKVYLDKFNMDAVWLESVDFSVNFKVQNIVQDRFLFNTPHLDYIQSVLLFWNLFNDLIIGFVQDLGICGMKWIKNRRKVLLYVAPFYSISFLIFWFPWSKDEFVVAFQLLFCFFFFDTFQTLILSAYFGMCVEKFRKHQSRVRIFVYAEVATVIAGTLILPIESMTDNLQRYNVFQVFVVGITLVATSCMLFGAKNLKNQDMSSNSEEDVPTVLSGEEEIESTTDWRSIIKITWQIIKEFRFIALVGSQFFKILRYMANEQFLVTYVEILLTENSILRKGSSMLGLYYIIARSLGSILFILLWIPVKRVGCQWVIHGINLLTLVNCAVAYYAGSSHFWILASFVILENTFSRCGWQSFYMIISAQVIDSDREVYHRKLPFSTIVFSLKTLFTKPADQLASVIVLGVLQMSYYHDFKLLCWPNSNTVGKLSSKNNIANEISFTDLELRCTNIKSATYDTLIFLPLISLSAGNLQRTSQKKIY